MYLIEILLMANGGPAQDARSTSSHAHAYPARQVFTLLLSRNPSHKIQNDLLPLQRVS
jgi:hypothetical protein